MRYGDQLIVLVGHTPFVIERIDAVTVRHQEWNHRTLSVHDAKSFRFDGVVAILVAVEMIQPPTTAVKGVKHASLVSLEMEIHQDAIALRVNTLEGMRAEAVMPRSDAGITAIAEQHHRMMWLRARREEIPHVAAACPPSSLRGLASVE